MKRLRVLIVGVGSIGERHLRCFQQTGRVDLAVCERLVERRKAVAVQYGVAEVYGDVADAVDAGFDAAVIATPAHLHIPVSMRLAEAGCHLLIEKPVSTSMDGVADLVRVVEEKHLVSAVGYVHRAHPMMQKMKQALDAGRFLVGHSRRSNSVDDQSGISVTYRLPGGKGSAQRIESSIAINVVCILGKNR